MVRTQAELAELVGYSRVTVSKALSGHPSVLPETRQRILEAARDVGYRPNAAARSMRSGRFGGIALVLAADGRALPLASPLLRGVCDAAGTRDLILSVCALEFDDGQLLTEPRVLRELWVDGLLIRSGQPPEEDPVVPVIERYHVPAVWIGALRRTDSVVVDELAAARMATDHLLRLGHRRIACLAMCPCFTPWVQQRIAGYRHAMQQAGLEPVVVEEDASAGPIARRRMLEGLLAPADRPTACVIVASGVVRPLIATCAARGLGIPAQLSLVTVCAETCEDMGMAVTAVRQPCEAVGAAAVEMLAQRIDVPAVPIETRTLAPPPMDDGQTTAPPGM
jgi:LacI family transcriptional regulator